MDIHTLYEKIHPNAESLARRINMIRKLKKWF